MYVRIFLTNLHNDERYYKNSKVYFSKFGKLKPIYDFEKEIVWIANVIWPNDPVFYIIFLSFIKGIALQNWLNFLFQSKLKKQLLVAKYHQGKWNIDILILLRTKYLEVMNHKYQCKKVWLKMIVI